MYISIQELFSFTVLHEVLLQFDYQSMSPYLGVYTQDSALLLGVYISLILISLEKLLMCISAHDRFVAEL